MTLFCFHRAMANWVNLKIDIQQSTKKSHLNSSEIHKISGTDIY